MSKPNHNDAVAKANQLKKIAAELAFEGLSESLMPKMESLVNSVLTKEADEEMEESLSEQEELDEDFDLSSFLQEDETEDEPTDDVTSDDVPTSDEVPTEDPATDAPVEDPGLADDASLADLTVGDLKKLFQDIISGGSDEFGAADVDADAFDPATADMDDEPSTDFEEPEEDPDLDEILAELDIKVNGEPTPTAPIQESKLKKELSTAKKLLKEANSKLVELNLLNAKLIYSSKLFNSISLTENQKRTAYNQFEKAKTTKEAKLVFESLKATYSKTTKSKVQENLGFASAPAGKAPKKPTAEIIDTDFITRQKALAGIR